MNTVDLWLMYHKKRVLYHLSPWYRHLDILEQGLLTSKSQGPRPVIWLTPFRRILKLAKHLTKVKEAENAKVFSVYRISVPSELVRKHGKYYYTYPRSLPPWTLNLCGTVIEGRYSPLVAWEQVCPADRN